MAFNGLMKFVKAPWNNGVYTNIFTPRPYQIELLECALHRNTIVCLNTAAGKRFISTMVLRESIVKCSDDRQLEKQLALLLLNDDDAVTREYELLSNHLDISIARCVDGQCPHTEEQWKNLFDQNQIVIATPQKVLDCFEKHEDLACNLQLLILDECHQVCVDTHPYRKLIQILDKLKVSPNILGLTTAVLSDDMTAEKLQMFIHSMEEHLHSKAETATDLIALDRYTLSRPNEKIILSTDHHPDQDEDIEKLYQDLCLVLNKALNWIQNCQVTSQTKLRTTYWQISNLENEDPSSQSLEEGSSQEEKEQIMQNCSDDTLDELDLLQAPAQLLEEVLLVLEVLGPWCVYRFLNLILKQLHKALLGLERKAKSSGIDLDDDVLSGAVAWQISMLRYVYTILRMAFVMCHKLIGGRKQIDLKLVSPKVHRLLQVLKEYKPLPDENKQSPKYNDRSESDYVSWWQDSDAEDEEETQEEGKKEETFSSLFVNLLCGIVFVQEKCVAMMLQRLIRELCKEDKELKHVCSSNLLSTVNETTVGQCDIDAATMDKAKQEEVLRKFRSHETNLLICTGGLQDCAFIPKCNLIVRFDVPRSYRSYAQSKSRARAHTSAYIMLVREAEKHEFMEKLQEYKKIERVLQGPGWSEEQEIQLEEGLEDSEQYSDILPSYSTGPHACATMRNAIKIVNRYCCRLPSDPFTHLSPRCDVIIETDVVSGQPLYRCVLQMPINSHVRDRIQGLPMPTAIMAQRAVALQTCKRLHLAGELDDNLMPIGKETVKYAEELDPWKPEATNVTGRPGSTKRRQTYEKETPLTLSHCLPIGDRCVFIYEIQMQIRIPLSDELNVRRRKLYFPEDAPRGFGILTTKPIPLIPGFPIFTRSGEESARLKLCRSFVALSAQHLSLVRSFHRYVFSDILRLDRDPLSFKPGNATSQILVVALNRASPSGRPTGSSRLDIDWTFMVRTDARRQFERKMRRDPWYNHRMSERQKKFHFSRETYEDGVVIAKYRSCDQPNRFYVAEIKQDLTPASQFPSNEYQSFQHYYRHKYGLDIRCLDQPLLDVDHTSSRLNLLTPRHLNQKGKSLPLSSLEKKRARYESLHNRQILVPELCEVHPIPASLWRKAVCLPSILYRISQLLISEELRQSIAQHSGIAPVFPPVAFKWPDLDFGWSSLSGSSVKQGSPITNNDCDQNHDITKVERRPIDEITSDEHEQNHDITNENHENNHDMTHEEHEQNHDITNNDHEKNHDVKNEDHQTNHNITNEKHEQNQDTTNEKYEQNHDITNEKYEQYHDMTNEDSEQNQVTNNGDEQNHLAATHEHSNSHETSREILCDASENKEPFATISNGTTNNHVIDNDRSDASDSDSASFCSGDWEQNFDLSDDDEKKSDFFPSKTNRLKKLDILQCIPKATWDDVEAETRDAVTGPGPGLILQALTLSNASDGFNLERLEMLGDSFLKHAVTVYLYCTYPDAHEGKLSYMRSKKVSNCNLYRIGRRFGLAGKMTTLIFDPTVNWMPTGFVAAPGEGHDGSEQEENEEEMLSEDEVEIGVWTGVPGASPKQKPSTSGPSRQDTSSSSVVSQPSSSIPARQDPLLEAEEELYEEEEIQMIDGMLGGCIQLGGANVGSTGTNGKMGIDIAKMVSSHGSMHFTDKQALRRSHLAENRGDDFVIDTWTPVDLSGKPLNNRDPLLLDLRTQHSLADKSVADCVEALLGSYLTSCGQRAAQLLLCHLGLVVLPRLADSDSAKTCDRFGHLDSPRNELHEVDPRQKAKLDQLLLGLSGFERRISYTFRNKAYLLQAFTHASYHYNTVTDCYQRLEFLGDAVLDFLITRHLFHDERRHSPGALTDLRSALVNNTIFASLAVRYGFHKYFKSISPELQRIIEEFVSYQQRQEDAQGMDAQLMRHYGESTIIQDPNSEDGATSSHFFDCDEEEDGETEDVEVPKALGDIFESVAGAVYMDSGMDLAAVWKVYSPMMLPLIEKFSSCVPRSPVRELLEMEPETAKFSCAEKRYDGKVRVTVEIIGKGRFKGVGRSYRIAKSAAARRALRFLKSGYC